MDRRNLFDPDVGFSSVLVAIYEAIAIICITAKRPLGQLRRSTSESVSLLPKHAMVSLPCYDHHCSTLGSGILAAFWFARPDDYGHADTHPKPMLAVTNGHCIIYALAWRLDSTAEAVGEASDQRHASEGALAADLPNSIILIACTAAGPSAVRAAGSLANHDGASTANCRC